MGDVLRRILLRLEAPLLQRHCSDVLDEELSRVRGELDHVLAAYGRLQEVREAVTSLEHGRSDVRRSVSLMETVEATAMLHRELEQRVRLLETLLKARAVVQLSSAKDELADSKESSQDDGKRKRGAEESVRVKEEVVELPEEVKKLKKAKTNVHESPAIEAARSFEAMMAASWASPEQRGKSEPTSDTESEEDEPMPTIQLSCEDTGSQPANDALTKWTTQVDCAFEIVQQLANTKKVPAEELAPLVEDVQKIIESVPPNHSSHFRLLADGRFKELISLTTQILTFGKRNGSYLSIAESLVPVIEAAIARDWSMQGMRKYAVSLKRSMETMQQYQNKEGSAKSKQKATAPLVNTNEAIQLESESPAQGNESLRQWEKDVLESSKLAQRLVSVNVAPEVFDLDKLVQQVAQHLMTVPLMPNMDPRSLANGQFVNLLSLTTRLFEMGNRRYSYLQLIDFAIAAFDTAMQNHEALAVLATYRDSLLQARSSIQTPGPQPASQSTPPAATPVESAPISKKSQKKWKKAVHLLLAQAQRLATHTSKPSLKEITPFVGEFSNVLATASSCDSSQAGDFAKDDLFNLIASTTRIFKRPDLDALYLPALTKAAKSVDTFTDSDRKFRGSAKYGVELGAQRNRLKKLQQRQVPPPEASHSTTPSSKDDVTARFESLVSVADELLALPLSERRGRVSNYTFSLQKQLNATFPSKGYRPTTSREALSAVADAIKKAAELIQHEPHTEHNDTFYKQFLELLDSIGSRLSIFKRLIARSQDALSLYLYPDQNPPSNSLPKKAKANDGSTGHPEDSSLRDQLLEVYKRVQSWHDDIFSLKEFDEVMRVLRMVMAHKSKTWHVTRDRTVGDCLHLVAQRAQAIKKQEHREGRLASIKQWQSQINYLVKIAPPPWIYKKSNTGG